MNAAAFKIQLPAPAPKVTRKYKLQAIIEEIPRAHKRIAQCICMPR